ncbi:hypothetical protein HMH01_07925 [Halovulum dunhuangense]|uniref:Uncharacterized protein n=1 Tax=Halovulum dunhuangense TaxID=1505036 RepID=A0A849L218_9RHOB|nr:hypothetical protein [Halovulum dunhuangense]NNU80368.1 hypothetical protein [Halovulum dunhuangense]
MSAPAGIEAPEGDARALLDALSGVERPWLVERSVRVAGTTLRPGRFLVSFPRGALGPGPSRVLRGICMDLGLEEQAFAPLDALQSAAVSVHFGFEPEPGGARVKCYLEFPADARPERDAVFLALKWKPGQQGHHVLTRYLARDGLRPDAQAALIRDIVEAGALRDLMLGALDLAGTAPGLRLLEVVEDANPRRSVDLNLADARMTLEAAGDLLLPVMGPARGGRAYLDAHAGDRLGHVAAGTGRDGRPFFTLYHGARRLHAGEPA